MEKRLQAVLLGAGMMGDTHARLLKELGVELRGVMCTRRETAEAFAKRHHIPHYTDSLEEALALPADCVHVCTPPGAHYEAVRGALEAGRHVLCEKPLCLSPGEARALLSLGEEKGLCHGVDFNIRYHKGVREAAERLRRGELGDLKLIHGSYLQEFHALPAPADWRYDREKGGPMRAVTEIGSHWLDLCTWLTGERITAVGAVFSRFAPERRQREGMFYPPETPGAGALRTVESEDAAVIRFRSAGGALGSVVLCEASHGRVNRLSMEITGSEGSLWWDSQENNTLHSARRDQGINTRVFPFEGGFADSQRALLRAFYGAVERGTPGGDYPDFRDGLESARLCAAIYESAQREGAWVSLEEEA